MTATDPHAPLRQAVFDDAEIQALEHAWRNDAIRRVLDPVAVEVRDLGGSAADAFDAVQHGLNVTHVRAYLARGFTAHQAHVLLRDPNSWRILEPLDQADLDADFLHRPDVPRQVIVHLLRIAHSRDEATMFLDKYEAAIVTDRRADPDSRTPDELAASFANQVGLGDPEPFCGCPR